MIQSQEPEFGRSEFGFCSWCQEPLDSGEKFVFEMELSSWETGTPGLPEHEAVFLINGEPLASCKKCRAAIIANHESLREEYENLHRWPRIGTFLVKSFLLVIAILFIVVFFEAVLRSL